MGSALSHSSLFVFFNFGIFTTWHEKIFLNKNKNNNNNDNIYSHNTGLSVLAGTPPPPSKKLQFFFFLFSSSPTPHNRQKTLTRLSP